MAYVECNECGKTSEDCICRDCYNDIKNQLSYALDDIYKLEERIKELENKE